MQRSKIDAIPREGDVSFRQREIEPDRAALLVVDLQKGHYKAARTRADPKDSYLHDRIENSVIPNGQRLIAACRAAGAEVIDALAPLDNEIVIPKTSSSLFNSTNFEYVLRNLGVEYLMVMGMITDQCVETTIRDGCDRGFLMTVVEDACAATPSDATRNRSSESTAIAVCVSPTS